LHQSDFFAHPTSLVESSAIGAGTRIWAFCHILPGAEVGANCNLGDHCYVEGGVTVGDNVVVKNSVSLWTGVTLEDGVFVGPNVAFTNDLVPRAKAFREQYDRTLVCAGASLGANATVLCGITIGRFALVGAGAVVTRSVPDFGLVMGNPARLKGFLCRCGERLEVLAGLASCSCGRRYRADSRRLEESQ